MRKKITVFFMILLTLLLTAGVFAAGTQADPIVTLSYLTSTYRPYILNEADDMIDDILGASYDRFYQQLESMDGKSALYAALYLKNTNLSNKTVIGDNAPKLYTLKRGSIITGAPGTQFVISSGNVTAYAPDGGSIVNMTEGEDVYHGTMLRTRNKYMAADVGSFGVIVTSDVATVCVTDTHRVIGVIVSENSGTTPPPIDGTSNVSYSPKYTNYAEALNIMGLFKGTNSGFSLDRSATRTEAIVMLIRILGEESKALAYTGKHPFTDVPSWADSYVAYAYNMGYTTGTSATLFGADREVTQAQYLTFILRALGYNDAAGDFVWSEAPDKCVEFGVLSRSDVYATSQIFYRDQMAYCSYLSLYSNLKNSKILLIDKLISSGAVTIEAVNSAAGIIS